MSLPYDLIQPGVPSHNTSLGMTIVVAGIFLILLGSLLVTRRKRKADGGAQGPGS